VLGAGITLVGERMTIEKRGYGTIMVATLGGLEGFYKQKQLLSLIYSY
jgi:uncharacterized membrane protein (UPF0136 family)